MEMQMGRIKTRRRPLHENTAVRQADLSYQAFRYRRPACSENDLEIDLTSPQRRVNALAVACGLPADERASPLGFPSSISVRQRLSPAPSPPGEGAKFP